MKRSEMIQKILDVMKTYENCEITSQSAKDVLDCIEEAGMFPPEHLFTSGERADHYLQEWESEREPQVSVRK